LLVKVKIVDEGPNAGDLSFRRFGFVFCVERLNILINAALHKRLRFIRKENLKLGQIDSISFYGFLIQHFLASAIVQIVADLRVQLIHDNLPKSSSKSTQLTDNEGRKLNHICAGMSFSTESYDFMI
jgi:hypothetical protein